MRRIKTLGITVLLILVLSGCGRDEKTVETNNENISVSIDANARKRNKENPTDVIDRIINNEAYGDTKAIKKDVELLLELDNTRGQQWQEITKFWDKINEVNFVNMNELPDGLPGDGSFCIVVMGYCLNEDGTMRDELIGRLETALNAANKYKNAYVLVSGGGTASNNPEATEADSMAGWLMENGVESDRIIIENRSLTSATNAVYSYEILSNRYPEIKDIAIITSEYHVPLGCILYNTQFILSGSDIRVISNAAYESGNSHVFNRKSQADWIKKLCNTIGY